MSDPRALLARLNDDLEGLPRPDPAQVRATGERRDRRWLLVPAALAAASVVAAVVVLAEPPRRPVDVLEQATPSPSVGPSATPPAAVRAWLPPPWTLESSRQSALAEAALSEFAFCGRPVSARTDVRGDRTVVSEQVLVHPSGLRARLTRYETEAPGEAMNLFKLSYASCLVPGRAEGVGGPRNLWLHRGVAGGSDFGAAPPPMDGSASSQATVLHVVEISGSEQRPASRGDAAAALDAWADAG